MLVCVSFGLIGSLFPARGGGQGVSVLGIGPGVFLAGRAFFARLRSQGEAPWIPQLRSESGWKRPSALIRSSENKSLLLGRLCVRAPCQGRT